MDAAAAPARGNQPLAIKLLIEHGANIEHASATGFIAGKQRALHIAADRGNKAAVEALLNGGAEINPTDMHG